MNDTPIANNLEVKRSEEGKWLHLLPKELVGILPEGVWTTLTLDQKIFGIISINTADNTVTLIQAKVI